ncbi:MAG: NADH-quinone oxidoreductase subunit M [Thalassospira sp.]|nr:NADH-quinone oxidoreductase subunit M [Thalassospira sp.]
MVDNILSILILLPLVGALAVALLPASQARPVALGFSLAVFGLSIFLWTGFDAADAGFQFVEKAAWLPDYNIGYHVGIDGISLFFVLLSTLLTPICLLASWDSIKTRVREYCAAFLILETTMIGMFASLDILLFYVFFEAVLIPMFLIIGVWGGARRIYAAFKFFLYTLLGSVLLLVAILVLYSQANTTDLPTLMDSVQIAPALQTWLWLAFFASFAVKVPMVPAHTWLPDAHVEAPTAGSVILAGVLLKMGGYGFLRLSLPILPDASQLFAPLMFWLSIAAVVYTSLIALVQKDMKKLIAYSSIAHMAFVTAGIFAVNTEAVTGAVVQMLSHGLVSGALFLCVGVLYDRLHTREIAKYGGVVQVMPKFAVVALFFTMASVGLPGTSGFVGEFLVLFGVYQMNTLYASLLTLGVVLGAAYMLRLYRDVWFGAITNEEVRTLKDITLREKALFAPLIVLVLWMGIYPSSFSKPIEPAVERLVMNYHNDLLQSSTTTGGQP